MYEKVNEAFPVLRFVGCSDKDESKVCLCNSSAHSILLSCVIPVFK